MSVRLVLADTRRLVREALAEALAEEPSLAVVATAHDLRSAWLQAERLAVDVVVLAGILSDDGIDGASQTWGPHDRPARALVLDHTSSEESLLRAIEAGADGYIGGEVGFTGLVDAIRACARGETVVPPALLGPLLRGLIRRQRDSDRLEDQLRALTRRERKVLALLVAGGSTTTIAEQLVISTETARTHVQKILRKLDVHSRADAVVLVVRTGMADRLRQLVEGDAS